MWREAENEVAEAAEEPRPYDEVSPEELRARFRRRRRRRWAIFLIFIVVTGGLGLFFVLFVDWHMARSTRRRIYTADTAPEGKVALVLGARVYSSGRLSAMLEDRVLTAVDLYKRGKVQKLIMSGDNSRREYDEVSAMKNYAVARGVDPDDVVRDFAGFRTYDSLYRARDLWNMKELTIVTQRFHLPRAVYLARGLGIDAIGVVADRRAYERSSYRRSRIREIAARFFAFLDINILQPKPHFLGRAEGLSGNAQDAEVP